MKERVAVDGPTKEICCQEATVNAILLHEFRAILHDCEPDKVSLLKEKIKSLHERQAELQKSGIIPDVKLLEEVKPLYFGK